MGGGLHHFPGRGGGDPGLGPGWPLSSRASPGMGRGCGGGGRADCVRQTIIDPPLVYPWCLISINSSLKELVVDPGSLHPLPLGPRLPRGRWVRGRVSFVPGTQPLRIEGPAAASLLTCPYTGRGQGLLVGGAAEQRGDALRPRVDPGASLGEGAIPESRSGPRPSRARGSSPPLQSGGDGGCVWCVSARAPV